MGNSLLITIILRFFALGLIQVLVFNQLHILGSINPMVYLLFLYWYPVKENKATLILICFALGIFIDVFSDSMAIHTASLITAAFLRPVIMRFCFGVNYEFQSFKLDHTTKAQQLTFLALLILIHHLVFFSLEAFGWTHFLLIIKKTLTTGAISLLICLLLSTLFSKQKS